MSERSRDIVLRIDRKTGLLILTALIVTSAGYAVSQQLTMSATYPIPAGVYNQIVTTGNAGTSAADTTLNRNAGNTVLVPPTNSGGRVGVGVASPQTTLDVNGPVHIGSATTGSACTVQGSLAYDSSANAPVYCNGALWTAMGSAASGTQGGSCAGGTPIAPATSCGTYPNDNGPASSSYGATAAGSSSPVEITACASGWSLAASNYHWNNGAGGVALAACVKN
jgi:hypothetical protein